MTNRCLTHLWCVAVCTAAGASACGADGIAWASVNAHEITLPSLQPDAVVPTLNDLRESDEDHILVQFDEPITVGARNLLASHGITLLASLGANGYFAAIDDTSFDAQALSAAVRWVTAASIVPAMKLHRDLVDVSIDPMTDRYHTIPAWAVRSKPNRADHTAVAVVFHRDVTLADGIDVAQQHGAKLVSQLRTINAIMVELPVTAIHALAAEDAVQWIEPPLPALSGFNADNRLATQVDDVQASPYELDGTGVVVMLYDTGEALATHGDFDGRVTVHDAPGVADHSTHVAGTIGGSGVGSADAVHRGMAPNVIIEGFGFEQPGGPGIGGLYTDPGDLAQDYETAITVFGAVLSNNSIGANVAPNGLPCEWEGDYGVTSQLIDSIVRGDLGSPISAIWANGNERQDLALCGDSYATTPPPATAKNHLSVGAVNSNDLSVTDFTSFGPCDDGRLRPDVVAPGCQTTDDIGVTSTSSTGAYSVKCGTSMAAPTVTGGAALLLEDFRAQFPSRPDYLPSTNKALIIHTAMDIEDVGPDYKTGYGLVQLRDAIDFMRTGNFLEGEIHAGQTAVVKLQVTRPVARAVVTLAWDDFPGTPNVDPALVNNLNMVIIGPGGAYHPWTLDPAAPELPAVRTGPNSIDNVEQVVIDNPLPGTYTVAIVGFDVPEGPQRYSVAVSPMMVATQIQLVGDAPQVIPPGEPIAVIAQVIPINDTLVPDSVMLNYRFDDGPFTAIPMSPVGGDEWMGILPPATCADNVEYYVRAQGVVSGQVTIPSNAPTSVLAPDVAVVTTMFADDFEQDTGWTVENGDGLADGAWDRGTPAGAGDRGDPLTDADGSGQCYLTDNVKGNSDVDDGFTRLVSPLMDASAEMTALRYSRWYSNDSGASEHEDIFEVDISDNDGLTWINLETIGPGPPGVSGGWIDVEFDLAAIPGFVATDQFRVRFTASDYIGGSIIEAGVDAVLLLSTDCMDVKPTCTGDFDSDGAVNTVDLLNMLGAWGTAHPTFDIAPTGGDGLVAIQDLLLLLSLWGDCQ